MRILAGVLTAQDSIKNTLLYVIAATTSGKKCLDVLILIAMEENRKRPNAALINREWFESAVGVLQKNDLCDVLYCAVSYVLYGDQPLELSKSASIVFAMIRPVLDSDIEKYNERCARNAANAKSHLQRVVASGSESQRVVANTTPTTTTTTNSTQSLSTVVVKPDEIERDRWIIFGYFWSTGSGSPVQEFNAFWDYYESLGWRNNKGAAIVRRLACARQWRRQFDTKEPPFGAACWAKAVENCPVRNYDIYGIYAGAEKIEDGVRINLRCKADFLEKLEHVLPSLRNTLAGLFRSPYIDLHALIG